MRRFKVLPTYFPYKEGWGVIMKTTFNGTTIIDTGLTKEQAEESAKQLRKQYGIF